MITLDLLSLLVKLYTLYTASSVHVADFACKLVQWFMILHDSASLVKMFLYRVLASNTVFCVTLPAAKLGWLQQEAKG